MDDQGTLSVSWTLPRAIDPISLMRRLDPYLQSWFLSEATLAVASYSLLTNKDERFHRQTDYKHLLSVIEGQPVAVILHMSSETRGPGITGVETWVSRHKFGPTKVRISITGSPLAAVVELRERTWQHFGALLGELTETEPLPGSDELRVRGGSASGRSDVIVSVFDQSDTGRRVLAKRIPRVFISYSHDSDEHKAWVLTLAQRLAALPVWLLFDQWDLNLGGDLPRFMEQGISTSDYVLVICTENYNQKANQGIGGSGYEKMIMTADLMQDQNTERFIPIVRGNQQPSTPTFLGSRLYADFTNDEDFERGVDAVAQTILGPRSKRPGIGPIADGT